MFVIYSLLYSLAFVLMLPLFVLRREKYSAGFLQRLGYLPEFKRDSRPVLWLHCVSVGETNAARPLVEELKNQFPAYRVVVSTTTKTGQQLARKIFADKTDAVFYFPFDWKFSVHRALRVFRPSVVLLMETEIWPRFFCEVHNRGAHLGIVNGRLSEKSYKRYSYIKSFLKRVLGFVDLALMQGDRDAARIISLGIAADKVSVTGNLKFDQQTEATENALTAELRERFGLLPNGPLIIAASTHAPEEKWLLESFGKLRKSGIYARLMIAPRHPERFDEVAELIANSNFAGIRRSGIQNAEEDSNADIILLDSIGELRAAYPLAEIVFVSGSLIRHGGQSVLEPAAAGKAIVTGPFTHNFDAVVREFLDKNALIQLPETPRHSMIPEQLCDTFSELLADADKRHKLGENAESVMAINKGSAMKTMEKLSLILRNN